MCFEGEVNNHGQAHVNTCVWEQWELISFHGGMGERERSSNNCREGEHKATQLGKCSRKNKRREGEGKMSKGPKGAHGRNNANSQRQEGGERAQKTAGHCTATTSRATTSTATTSTAKQK